MEYTVLMAYLSYLPPQNFTKHNEIGDRKNIRATDQSELR